MEWFKRQLFGSKSERRLLSGPDGRQLALGERFATTSPVPVPAITVPSHSRRRRQKPWETWLEENIPQGLTVFELPAEHRLRLRTTNGLELLNKELKRRTQVASLFPNEASLLRLVSAILIEVSEEWETGRLYLTMESR